MWGHMTHVNFFGSHFGFYKKCSFWPETPFGEETRQFRWNFWFPSTFGSHFDQEILTWGCQYINKKCLGDQDLSLWVKNRKKFLRAAILDFMKNAPFDLKHLLVKRWGNFDEIFGFRAPLVAILTRKYWPEGANISTKNVWETKIYHYERKTEKNFRGQPFWILWKMLLLTWNTFWWRDEAILMKFLVPEHLWRPFWPGNIVLRVPIYNNIDEIIGFWAPLAAFISNSKHHLACKHFDQHIPHIY